MKITIYSKPNCKKCSAAKDKINNYFKLESISRNLEDINLYNLFELNKNAATDLMAARCLYQDHVPIIQIDDNFYDYSQAMKFLKGVVL